MRATISLISISWHLRARGHELASLNFSEHSDIARQGKGQMLLLLLVQAAAGQTAPSQAAPVQQALNLTCFGGGTANQISSTSVNTYGSFSGSVGTTPISGQGNNYGTITSRRQQTFDDQVDIRLFAGDDRIRMPRTMLPPLRGGKDGWFKLKNVVADARSIRAKAAVNFMNNPNVFIDRVTGTISISGKSGDYSGQCEAMPTDTPAKF